MRSWSLPLLMVCALLADPRASRAATPVRAVRTDHPIVVDGVLDETVWKGDNAVVDFVQSDPDQGNPPRQRTEVRVAYDDEALYVGARMFDTAPDSIRARMCRRDQSSGTDYLMMYIDPFHDRRTGYYFAVSAAGVQGDGVLYNDGWNDDSWDGVWNARVKRDAQGWTAEMRIPFSQIRYAKADPVTWGINFLRFVSRTSENDQLAYTPRGQSGFVSRFPELTGLSGLHGGHAVEVTPYVTSKAEKLLEKDGERFPSDDPFHGNTKLHGAVGGDLRTSLGSKLTLNATVNPDFGQVEIDPAVVNLSDVETYFGEKRPFFTEGLGVFRTGNNGANDYWGFNWSDPTFFYTRRIGRAPEGGSVGPYTDAPTGVHILGAAKITGQPAQGWNVGAVQALTSREQATFEDPSGRTKFDIEPMSYYGVLRGMREMNDRRQGLGLMSTTVVRDLPASSPLSPLIDQTSQVTTLDGWTFLDSYRTWVMSGWASASNVTGTRERMTALQRSSTHYFQRPDVGYLGVDSAATSLFGYGARVWLNKQNGRLLSNSAIGFMSQGFENNDLGFMSRADVVNEHTGIGWQWNEPKGFRQYANVIGAFANSWDMGGNHVLEMLYLSGQLEQRNHWSWNGSLFGLAPVLDARRTRGGPLMRTRGSVEGNLYFDTNGQSPFFWSISVNPSRGRDGSWEISGNPSANWKPVSNLVISAGPNFDRLHSDAQYVTTIVDPLAVETFGSRYVFAQLDQTTASAEFRVDYAARPNLSLQVYVQPLVSTGRYFDYKYLARGRSYDFAPEVQPPANPDVSSQDFTYRSIRGNAVFRWEYLPGSTFFAVWTQDRTDIDGEDEFHLHQSLSTLARSPANNVFLIKVAHHFDM